MALILTLDAALAEGSVGLVRDGHELVHTRLPENPAAALAPAVSDALATMGARPDLVAVTVGPGSFTGLRASIALAHGIGLGAGVAVIGVTVAAALAAAAPPGRALWTAIDTKRGTILLHRGKLHCDAGWVALTLADPPPPEGPVALAGDAAPALAAAWASVAGADAVVLAPLVPVPLGIAAAVARGETVAPQPLYGEAPLARPGPAPRPPPV